MTFTRRAWITGTAGAVAATALDPARAEEKTMYGLIGRMTAKPGQRGALAAAILDGSTAMPGNLSYVVALDAKDPDAIWITEYGRTRRATPRR